MTTDVINTHSHHGTPKGDRSGADLVQGPDAAGLAVSPPEASAQHRHEVSALLDVALAGKLPADWATAERRIVRTLGALSWLQGRHEVDGVGRCSVCRAAPSVWWPWPRRTVCTVHTALLLYMGDPTEPVPEPASSDTADAGGVS